MTPNETASWLDEIKWSPEGLVPAIAQDQGSGRILTLAWMNRAALLQTVRQRRAVYWSRSRQRLWLKGETSGHFQEVQEIYLDCDKDTIVLKVIQVGGIACHTGRASCFYHRLEEGVWTVTEPVIRRPEDIYGKPG